MKTAQYQTAANGKEGILLDCDHYQFVPCEYIPYTVGSDYSGDIVTRSNFLVLVKRLSRIKGLYRVYGGYGTYGIAYIPAEMTKRGLEIIYDILHDLATETVYDEDHMCNLERNIIIDEFRSDYKYHELPKKQRANVLNIVLYGMGEWAYTEAGCLAYIDCRR